MDTIRFQIVSKRIRLKIIIHLGVEKKKFPTVLYYFDYSLTIYFFLTLVWLFWNLNDQGLHNPSELV